MRNSGPWILMILCLLLAGCSKPRVVYATETEEKNGVQYVKGDSRPFTGIVIDRNTARELHFENGVGTKTADLRDAAPASMFNAEIDRRVHREGGALTGDVRISLIWHTTDDLDLHCRDPHGEVIYFGHRRSSSRGELDVDMNVNHPFSTEPVENIVWPVGRAPKGEYIVYVHCFTHRRGNPLPAKFTVAINARGNVKYIERQADNQEKVEVHRFRID